VKEPQVLIVEHEIGENTNRLKKDEIHHEQSGLGVEIIPQVTPTKLLELPGIKKSPEKMPRQKTGSHESSRSQIRQ